MSQPLAGVVLPFPCSCMRRFSVINATCHDAVLLCEVDSLPIGSLDNVVVADTFLLHFFVNLSVSHS